MDSAGVPEKLPPEESVHHSEGGWQCGRFEVIWSQHNCAYRLVDRVSGDHLLVEDIEAFTRLARLIARAGKDIAKVSPHELVSPNAQTLVAQVEGLGYTVSVFHDDGVCIRRGAPVLLPPSCEIHAAKTGASPQMARAQDPERAIAESEAATLLARAVGIDL